MPVCSCVRCASIHQFFNPCGRIQTVSGAFKELADCRKALSLFLLSHTAPPPFDSARRPDLASLGLDHLMGTPMLRAYMHGFFVDNRLYEKAKILTDPFAYETYRSQRVQKKLEEERQSRISLVKKLPRVNARVAARILAEQEGGGGEGGDGDGGEGPAVVKGKKGLVANPLADARFAAMFEEEDFAVDEQSAEYRLLHPNVRENAAADAKASDLLRQHFDVVSDDDEEAGGSGGSELEELDDFGEAPQRQRALPGSATAKRGRGAAAAVRAPGVASGRVAKPTVRAVPAGPTMYAVKDAASLDAFRRGDDVQGREGQTLAERAAVAPAGPAGKRVGGSREL
eukprot:264597-Chlamydomonas_euryale.AAC.1